MTTVADDNIRQDGHNFGASMDDIIRLLGLPGDSLKSLTENVEKIAKFVDQQSRAGRQFGSTSATTQTGRRGYLAADVWQDFSRSSKKSLEAIADSLDSFSKKLDRQQSEIDDQIEQTKHSLIEKQNLSGLEIIQYRERLKLLEQAKEKEAATVSASKAVIRELNDQLSELEVQKTKYELFSKRLNDTLRGLSAVNQKIERYEEANQVVPQSLLRAQTRLEADRARYQPFVEEYEGALERIAQAKSKEIETTTEALEDVYRKRIDAEDELTRRFLGVSNALGVVSESTSNAAGVLQSAAEFDKTLKENEYQRAQEVIDNQRIVLQNAFDQLSKSLAAQQKEIEKIVNELNVDGLTDERRAELSARLSEARAREEFIMRDIKLIQKQQAYYAKLTPITDVWRNVGNEMKKIPGTVFKSMAGNVASYFTKRFVDDTVGGFDKVYNSIETTRNEISNRLRLNQGDFSDLQSDIQEEIELQGLEGSVAQSDVNDALVSLASAGITDKEMLKTFALESAKLKAAGIDLDITNEETLERFMNMMEQGSSVDEIKQLIENAGAQMQATKDLLGSGTAFIGGGGNTIMNQVLDMATAYGKSAAEASEDIGAAFYSSQQSKNIGIDPQAILEQVNKIIDGTVSDLDNFGKVLYSKGFGPDQLANMSLDEIIAAVGEQYMDVFEGVTPQITPYVNQVYGTGLRTKDIMRMQQSNGVNVQLPDNFASIVSDTLADTTAGLQNNEWISATKSGETYRENLMTEAAIQAEKFYKGDDIFHSVTEPIVSAIGEIKNLLVEAGSKTISYMIQGGAAAGGAAAGSGGLAGDLSGGSLTAAGGMGGAAKNLLTGARGTVAGKIGRAGGFAVGAGMAIHSMIEADSARDFLTDPEFYSGAAGAVASAVGGPLAGVLVGALAGAGAKIGNAIADSSWTDKIYTEDANIVNEWNEVEAKLSEAANSLMESATAQISAAQQELDNYKKMTPEQKKMLLLQEGKIGIEEANALSESEINDKFASLIELQEETIKKEQAKIKTANILANNKTGLTNLETNLKDLTGLSTENGSGSGGLSEASYRVTQLLGGTEQAGNMAAAVLDLMSASPELTEAAAVEELFKDSNMSDEAKAAVTNLASDIKQNKDAYSVANKTFRDRWDQAKAAAGSDNVLDIVMKYGELFSFSGGSVPNLKTSGAEGLQMDMTQGILLDSDGYPMLYDAKGTYDPKAYEGRFKSGLTSVPYDDYPALLHEGERVLTREEALAYNNLSSYAIENLGGDTISTSDSFVGDSSFVESIININQVITNSFNIACQFQILCSQVGRIITPIQSVDVLFSHLEILSINIFFNFHCFSKLFTIILFINTHTDFIQIIN